MAGLILNLASLKSKADTAGVANTANNTTPNLCPLKSAITGYVTNGASVVKFSGTWASNLLVEDACVSVNKTITNSQTVYRNINVGSQQGGSDIPASGGSSFVYKTITYEYATKTTYSDGTSVTTTYSSGAYTVYGSTITASNLATTLKSRTKIGTSSGTETVAGTSVSVSGDIYLADNSRTSETVYKDVEIDDSDADYIPASGGQSRAYALVTYSYATKYTYSSGSTSTTSYSSVETYIYGEYVSAESLGTTMKNVTSTGKASTPIGVVAGSTRIGGSVTIYLAANYITSIEATTLEGYTMHVKYDDMPADGGTVSPLGTARCIYTFKSGATETSDLTTPFTGVTATYSRSYSEYSDPSNVFSVNTSTGAVTAGANTSTANTRVVTIMSTLTISVSYSSAFSSLTKPSSSTITHYPTCTLSKAAMPTVTGGYFYFTGDDVSDIPASGGVNSIPNITTCLWVTQYSNGASITTSISTSSVTWYYGKCAKNSTYYDSSHVPAYTAPAYYLHKSYGQFNLGLNAGSRDLKGWVFIKGVYNGSTDYIRKEVWQAAGSENYALNATYNIDPIPYYGGTAIKPYLTGIVLYHIVNGTIASLTTIPDSDLLIIGYTNNDTGIAPDSDSSYTSAGYLTTMDLNASTNLKYGNWIFMRFKYTPSGWSLLVYTYKKLVRLDANSETGFILTINNPEGSAAPNPVIHFCYGDNSIKYSSGSYLSHQYTIPQSWINNWTGVILKIAVTRVNDHPAHISDYVYLSITGYTESGIYVNILQKTNISTWFYGDDTSDFMSLTNSFNASDFNNGGYARIVISFSKT